MLDGSGYWCIADLAESLCASNSAQQDGGRYNRFPHCYPPYKANKGNHLLLQLWRDYGQRRKVCQSFAGESKPRSGVKSLARGASPSVVSLNPEDHVSERRIPLLASTQGGE